MATSTVDALFRRGIPENLAKKLSGEGFTLAQLQQLPVDRMVKLGLLEADAKRIQNVKRPPVPSAVVTRLMHACRRTCCVCRNRNRSLVLHHTQAWATSHSHDEDLLVVLCVNCHAEAHTTRELGRNLTSEELLRHKEIWTSFVSRSDSQTLLSRNARPELLGLWPVWDYFNHRRIVRTAMQMGIDPTSMPSYASLGQNANIDVDGGIDWGAISNDRRDTTSFMYEGAIRNAEGVYNYFADLLTSVVCESDWIDLRSCWSKPKLKAMVTPGAIALLTAGFRYRSANTMSFKGPGQIRSGYYQKAGIRLQFRFDGWEITSVSSRGHLSGIWRSAAVCLVRSIDFDYSPTVIETTCLGIGTGFDNSCYPGPIVAQFATETDV